MDKLIQQVNFYQPIFRREKKPFSAVTVAINTGIAVFLMLLASLYSIYQLNEIQQRVDVLEQRKQTLVSQLDELKKTLKPRTANHLLTSKKEKLAGDLRDARRLFRLLDAEVSDVDQLYSAYFRGLAEVGVNGLWLKDLEISQGGEFLSLSGQTLKPELVPRLLQSLQNKAVFAGHSFGKVQMNRESNEEFERAILFHLETLKAEEVKNDAG